MLRHLRTSLVALAVVGMLAVPATSAFAGSNVNVIESETAPPMVDLFLMRPLGLGMLLISGALWVPAQAATMVFHPRDYQKPIDIMLKKPVKFVFLDPLGEH